MTNKKIIIRLPDEDSEFFSDLLTRDDIDIVSDDTDENIDFMIITHEDYMSLHQAISKLSEEKSIIIHELKSSVASVKGYTDVILSGMTGEITEQQEVFLQTIQSNANKMLAIIDNMGGIAKIATGPMPIDKSPFQILPLINETLKPFKKMLDEKQQTVTISVPDNLPEGLGDEVRVMQILTNIISNAHKYSNEGDTIELKVSVIEDFIQFSVTDTGIGIEEEDLEKIFKERYFRGENAQHQSGTGLGMILCRNVITAMNGQIWVESELDKGSTFHFTIPISTV